MSIKGTEAQAGLVLGTESFTEWVRKTFIGGQEIAWREQPQAKMIRGIIPAETIARVVGEEYGIGAKELLKARSRHREARRVLLEMSYRLNMGYRPLVSIGEEVGGVGGAALRNNHVRLLTLIFLFQY